MRNVLCCLLLLVAVPAMAAEAPKGTLVTLSARAERMLPNNEVVVFYRIAAEGPKTAVLRDKVNRISRVVDVRLAREKGVAQATTGRRIEPIWRYDSTLHRQVRVGWRLVQSGRATSSHLDAVPAWVNAIEQAGAHLNGLRFRVSEKVQNAARDRLRMQAIAEFRERAATTAKALGASSFRILSLNTNTVLPRPIQPMMAAMAKVNEATPPPVMEAGQGQVAVTVSGEILLPEKDYPVK